MCTLNHVVYRWNKIMKIVNDNDLVKKKNSAVHCTRLMYCIPVQFEVVNFRQHITIVRQRSDLCKNTTIFSRLSVLNYLITACCKWQGSVSAPWTKFVGLRQYFRRVLLKYRESFGFIFSGRLYCIDQQALCRIMIDLMIASFCSR